jgi:hypothetical protein
MRPTLSRIHGWRLTGSVGSSTSIYLHSSMECRMLCGVDDIADY